MPEAAVPRVSVVIASHRPEYVAACVHSISGAACGDVAHEVIVVADYDVRELTARLPNARWIHHANRSIPAKRNVGVAAAQGEVVAFTDDDCRACDRWLPQAVAYLDAHPTDAGVQGMTSVANQGERGLVREFRRLELRGYRTNNMFYRRAVLLEAGGFDERFTVQREDVDCAFNILSRGHSIGYDPSIRVTHSIRHGEKWDLLKNCVNRRFDPLLHKKHRAQYRRHIGSPFPPSLVLLLGLHAALLMSLLGAVVPWALVGALDAATVTALALRRSGLRPAPLLREWISFACAPVVLLAALMHGNVKFRWLLVF